MAGGGLWPPVVVKQMVSFYQVITLFASVYSVQYPELYLEVLGWFAFVNLDFALVFRLECMSSYSWHFTMYLSLLLFAALTGLQFVLLVSLEAAGRGRAKLLRRMTKLIVLVTYLLYPSLSNTLFQAFNCQAVDGRRYLRRDFSIDCDDAAHRAAQWLAGLGIGVCSIGTPVLYLAVLWRNGRGAGGGAASDGDDDHVNDGNDDDGNAGAAGRTARRATHLDFFVQDYKPEFWYWEAIELWRKLLLTGFAALWVPGTLMQVITSILITLAHLVMVARAEPYRGHACARAVRQGPAEAKASQEANCGAVNSFAVQAVLMTFLALLGALLVKFHSGFQSTGAVEPGYDYQAGRGAVATTVCGDADIPHQGRRRHLPRGRARGKVTSAGQ